MNELKNDLITEIKSLIQLELKKVVKKQKKKKKKKLQELEKDGLEQYRRRVCVRIEDVPVEFEETIYNVYKKFNLLKVVCLDVLVSCIDTANRIGAE